MSADQPPTYVESSIIMTTVRLVVPFVLTYGLFITFHGAESPGGGFQGGAIVGTVVLMMAFAFGIDPTRRWLRNSVVTALAGGGVVAFAVIGLGPIARGGAFLEYGQYLPADPSTATKWGMEAVEIVGIGAIVSGVIVGLFFVTAAGFAGANAEPTTDANGDSSTPSNDGSGGDES